MRSKLLLLVLTTLLIQLAYGLNENRRNVKYKLYRPHGPSEDGDARFYPTIFNKWNKFRTTTTTTTTTQRPRPPLPPPPSFITVPTAPPPAAVAPAPVPIPVPVPPANGPTPGGTNVPPNAYDSEDDEINDEQFVYDDPVSDEEDDVEEYYEDEDDSDADYEDDEERRELTDEVGDNNLSEVIDPTLHGRASRARLSSWRSRQLSNRRRQQINKRNRRPNNGNRRVRYRVSYPRNNPANVSRRRQMNRFAKCRRIAQRAYRQEMQRIRRRMNRIESPRSIRRQFA